MFGLFLYSQLPCLKSPSAIVLVNALAEFPCYVSLSGLFQGEEQHSYSFRTT